MEERDVRLVRRIDREDLHLIGKLPIAAIQKPRAERNASEHRVLWRLVEGGRLAAAVADEDREG